MTDKSRQLAIIIVEFNTPDDTIKCLETLEAQLGERCKLFIYDNSAEESTQLKERLEASPVPYEYHFNNGNVGFAKGCNLGLARAKEDGFDYAMLLNSDTLMVDDSPLLAFDLFEQLPDVGVLGLVNYFSSRPTEIWQAGKTLRKSNLGFHPVAMDAEGPVTYCDYVPGSSFIIRLSLLDSVGLLDENYFAYYEEIDFCFRAKDQGYRVAYINDSKILHHVGHSSNSAIKSYLKTRNKLYFYRTILNFTPQFFLVTSTLLVKDFLITALKDRCIKCLKYMWVGIRDYRQKNMEFKRFQ